MRIMDKYRQRLDLHAAAHLLIGAAAVAVARRRRRLLLLEPAEHGRAAAGARREVSSADLLTPGPLGDQVMGAANAPVTIIEYASMTCPHCALSTRPPIRR